MRLLGFVIGLILGGLGLLMLVNPPLAVRARDAMVDWVQEQKSPTVDAAVPAPRRAGDAGPEMPASAEATSAPPTVEDQVEELRLDEERDDIIEPDPPFLAREAAPSPSAPAGSAPPVSLPAILPSSDSDIDRPSSPPTTTRDPGTGTGQWYAIWSPFLTARAARGFADRLATLTGMEFTVIEIDQRKHQVAFAYADAEQRDTVLAIIEGETGLELERAK